MAHRREGNSYIYPSKDLIKRFNDNYQGEIAEQYKVVNYLSHPPGFDHDEARLDETFDFIDQFLVSNNRGPVIYVTLQQIYDDIAD